jgi:hypothetical protein
MDFSDFYEHGLGCFFKHTPKAKRVQSRAIERA